MQMGFPHAQSQVYEEIWLLNELPLCIQHFTKSKWNKLKSHGLELFGQINGCLIKPISASVGRLALNITTKEGAARVSWIEDELHKTDTALLPCYKVIVLKDPESRLAGMRKVRTGLIKQVRKQPGSQSRYPNQQGQGIGQTTASKHNTSKTRKTLYLSHMGGKDDLASMDLRKTDA